MDSPPDEESKKDHERVEELGAAWSQLTDAEISERLERLRSEGESTRVLTVLGRIFPAAAPAPLFPMPVLEAGDLLAGRYTLSEVIGRGGMGTVWRAKQKMIEREVAVKIIDPALTNLFTVRRFHAEMEILGRLEHPGIVRILDAGMHQHESGISFPFFAMEMIEGLSLGQWAAKHREDTRQLLDVMSEVCAAVQHAHDRQIIHRDLKPSNVIVRENGRPVVLDFGIARLVGGGMEDAPGLFFGTPQYAAPEQHLGRDQDFRSGESVDVYAAGAVLFEVLSGQRLFEFPRGARIWEMRHAILEGPLRRLREVSPGAAPVLDEITSRALSRDPAERYFSVALLGRALQRAATRLFGAAKAEPPWVPAAGTIIPGTHWRLKEKLGEGGTGQVWLGVHEELAERGVFKFCDAEDKVRSLKRELTLYRLLKERVGRNPHFIPLHEVSLEEPPWYLRMEFVEAQDLPAWCERQPGGLAALSLETKLEIVAQTAEALQAAHEAGLLHRDVKPANLLLGPAPGEAGDGSAAGRHVYVADFGIGQIVTESLLRGNATMSLGLTMAQMRTSTLSGTMLYLAPEVLEGQAATARSDIYSLGVILWQLLHGNLNAALNPTEWAVRIEDRLLVEDLTRCLAGLPEQRWPSAGALAANLRALPRRRVAEQLRQEEAARRERTAYRRGVLRASAIAAAVLAVVSLLALLAWHQRREALRARAAGALEQAASIPRRDVQAGRRARGMNLLEAAAEYPGDRTLIRSVAISTMALPDLVPESWPVTADIPQMPLPPGVTAAERSPDGQLIATGRARDQFSGKLEFLDPAGKFLRVFDQGDHFPWVPIPEPGLLRFTPDSSLLAIAGPATSNHILLYNVREARLDAYIYHGSGLTCLAWHPSGHLLASGRDDRVIQFWDTRTARVAWKPDAKPADAALPPALNERAIDLPAATLLGHRDRILSVAFPDSGEWMSSLDAAGWLRIWQGGGSEFLPRLAGGAAADPSIPQTTEPPPLAVESKLDQPTATELSIQGKQVVVRGPSGPLAAYEFQPGPSFHEGFVAQGLTDLAWDDSGRELCVISESENEIHWLDRESLQSLKMEKGTHPIAAAWDPSTQRWALPEAEEFVERPRPGTAAPPFAQSRWKPTPEDGQVARLAQASTSSGRIAVYYAHQIQMVRGGEREPGLKPIPTTTQGIFAGLVWDRGGRTLTVWHQTGEKMLTQSWGTSTGAPAPFPPFTLPVQRLVAAEDGSHLVGRSPAGGLQRIDASTGATQLLDGSIEARQDAALAVSPDGLWIAAVVDRWEIRLLRADGTHYATFSAPGQREISRLRWHPSGDWLATCTNDGYVQIWALAEWRAWMAQHHLLEY